MAVVKDYYARAMVAWSIVAALAAVLFGLLLLEHLEGAW